MIRIRSAVPIGRVVKTPVQMRTLSKEERDALYNNKHLIVGFRISKDAVIK